VNNATVAGIYISRAAGKAMTALATVNAIARKGLEGDRYAEGFGSFNRKKGCGHRQVTLINSSFFDSSNYAFYESRRNLVTTGVELMWLIGKEFKIGEATFRGVCYCDPCDRVTKLSGQDESFRSAFHDRGGLIAEVITSGKISIGDSVIPPRKNY
jgi:MOSC domain-containing protein YiiM